MHANPNPPVVVTHPAGPVLPIVIDSPHSGTQYPADFGAALPTATLRSGEDTWIDRLYEHAPAMGATLIAAQFPRVYIDPNRSLLDIDEALLDAPWPGEVARSRKTELGFGLVWRLMGEQAIYARKLPVVEVQGRIDRCWRPYHAELQSALDAAVATGGPRWHLNVHSMPDDAFRRLGLPEKPLADFVLGNLDGTTSAMAALDLLAEPLRAHGYSVAYNDPFKGVEIIRASGAPARGWQSVQIEVKRSLYMDTNLAPTAGFGRLQTAIDAMLERLAAQVRRGTSLV